MGNNDSIYRDAVAQHFGMGDSPKVAQRQDSLSDQLEDLIHIANKNGMYDAADYLRTLTSSEEND